MARTRSVAGAPAPLRASATTDGDPLKVVVRRTRGARRSTDIAEGVAADIGAGAPPCRRLLVTEHALGRKRRPSRAVAAPQPHNVAPPQNSTWGPRASATTVTVTNCSDTTKHSATIVAGSHRLKRWSEKQTSTGVAGPPSTVPGETSLP